jgi:hypothetical protein
MLRRLAYRFVHSATFVQTGAKPLYVLPGQRQRCDLEQPTSDLSCLLDASYPSTQTCCLALTFREFTEEAPRALVEGRRFGVRSTCHGLIGV